VKTHLFAALLKYERQRRGLSQLDLSLSADVSARHISFLETGRSLPSEQMVLLLAEVLDVPLRNRNALLQSAGFAERYAKFDVTEIRTGIVGTALTALLNGHEPYPVFVFDRLYNSLCMNAAASRLLDRFWPQRNEANLLKLALHEASQRTIENWTDFASAYLLRLQREVLNRPDDVELTQLLETLLAMPNIPAEWRKPRLDQASEPAHSVVLSADTDRLEFLTTVTAFNAPQNITLSEIRIESWYPTNSVTVDFCDRHLG
jgi:transcriptional regulator with XRE-family HTH domain